MIRPRIRALAAAFAIATLMSSGCTITQGNQYQVDWVAPGGYHFHIYRATSMMVWFQHSLCGYNPSCTLNSVRSQAQVNGIFNTLSGFDFFFDDDVADFDDALRSVPHPWPLSINLPDQYGCLGGYRSGIPYSDGDWYGDPPTVPWCPVGQALR